MYRVRDELCVGCGICAQSCPSQAITLCYGTARIEARRCIGCQTCSSTCPQGAIEAVFAGDLSELKARIQNLTSMKDWIVARLNQLTSKMNE